MSQSCDNNCASCGEQCASRTQPQDMKAAMNAQSNVKKVIGVISGKGGVGKSLVTSLLAANMQKTGVPCAVLDADVTGPSIPKVFGIKGKVYGDGENILPALTAKGTEIMSINLILENDTDPVLWRGPIIGNVVQQFWTNVIWGDIDYMFVDMPPGTGDVALTVFQSLPVDGIIVVTSPQELVGMIVEKAVKMADLMNIPIIGIVENMAYFECPDCHKKHAIFGESHLEEIAKQHGIDAVAQIPIQPEFARLCDAGRVEEAQGDYLALVLEKIKSL